MSAPAPSDPMVRLARRLEGWPRELRWLVFLPAGLIAALIVQGALDYVFDALRLPTSPETTGGVSRAGLQASVWAFIVTFVPAVLSPRPWAVGLVMFVVSLLVRISPVVSMMMVPYQREHLPSLAIAFAVVIGAHALGGAVALYLIRNVSMTRSVQE